MYEWDCRNRLVQASIYTRDAGGDRRTFENDRPKSNLPADAKSFAEVTLRLKNTVNYTYDVFDNRIAKGWTHYIPEHGQTALVYGDAKTAGKFDLLQRNLYADAVDQLLAADVLGQVVWLANDNQRTPKAILHQEASSGKRDTTGYVAYDAFGAPSEDLLKATKYHVAESNPLLVGNGRAGRDYDTTTGLYYNRARWYDPRSGRYVSRDPVGLATGDPNTYCYCGNSPTTRTDPWGTRVPSNMHIAMADPDPSWGNRIAGGLQVIASAAEMYAGAMAGPLGIPIVLHGADNLQAGVRQAYTGLPVQTETSKLLEQAALGWGENQQSAHLVGEWGNLGIQVVATAGAGYLARTPRAASYMTRAAWPWEGEIGAPGATQSLFGGYTEGAAAQRAMRQYRVNFGQLEEVDEALCELYLQHGTEFGGIHPSLEECFPAHVSKKMAGEPFFEPVDRRIYLPGDMNDQPLMRVLDEVSHAIDFVQPSWAAEQSRLLALGRTFGDDYMRAISHAEAFRRAIQRFEAGDPVLTAFLRQEHLPGIRNVISALEK
jgi:RHS repeat-associated protein